MDKKKLDELRQRFGDLDGAEYVTEKFKRAGEKMAGAQHAATKPYTGIPTFLDLPYNPDFEGLDVAMVGVPMDLGVTNRSGARFGPRAVRAIERVGPYSHALDEVPRGVLNAADIGDVPMRSRFSLTKSLEDKGVFPLWLTHNFGPGPKLCSEYTFLFAKSLLEECYWERNSSAICNQTEYLNFI